MLSKQTSETIKHTYTRKKDNGGAVCLLFFFLIIESMGKRDMRANSSPSRSRLSFP